MIFSFFFFFLPLDNQGMSDIFKELIVKDQPKVHLSKYGNDPFSLFMQKATSFLQCTSNVS